ncbi:rCG36604 [Rattus norvegicus]|uniref:RCG36604 n=1 Tax=Rattus norvegicus TaxID=10116 RepID=A6JSC1_RAT|nr:rCG36604 [Rattus norvegicus]
MLRTLQMLTVMYVCKIMPIHKYIYKTRSK